jgi:hypothetical protein
MKLVSSNEAETVEETIKQAVDAYRASLEPPAALADICKLKGVGPATASLLLSVHDAERVIFFSDEAFWWLCCSGKKAPIKYNAKEYQELNAAARALAERLDVSAIDIEKVAYVVMKGEDLPTSGDTKQSQPASMQSRGRDPKQGGTKRKDEFQALNDQAVRRSKRGKTS